uniref:Uncharacterized protein n=1 Tax=Tanacetum cinerariifolium TaxID=118510 RepID=A0A6L2N3B9_TANCI|nr:hypothetical protein [Tanacetum cinerariifolium]
MEKVFLGKDGKPMVAARHVQFNTTKGGDSLDASVNTFTNKGVSNPLEDVEDTMHVDQNKLQPEKDVAVQNAVKSSFVDVANSEPLIDVSPASLLEQVWSGKGTGVKVKKRLEKQHGVNIMALAIQIGMALDVAGEEVVRLGGAEMVVNVSNGDKVTKVPIWVKMHKVPIVAYSKDGLSLIATQIEKPIMLDEFTSAMCADSWGRLGFSQALIEVSAETKLKKEVIMVVPMVEDMGYIKEQPTKATIDAQEDGFTTLQNRKKKSKAKENSNSRQYEGLKLNKPKYTFVYRQKQPAKATNEDEINIIKLKNHFDALHDQEELIKECDVGESSRQNGSAGIHADPEPNSLDSDIEVKEGLNCTPKQTKVQQVVNENHLSVCAILESHIDIATLSKVCSKFFRCWDWTLNASLCAKDLGHRKHMVHGVPWVLMGDFNVVLNMEDCYSGSSCFNFAMLDFKDYVYNIEVMDINFLGLHFTWNQKPKGGGGLLKKLDRIMGNVEFLDSFLDGNYMYQVVSKLKLLKKPIRKLLHDYGNLHERANKLRLELDEVKKALDLNPVDVNLREEEAIYVQAFNDAKLDEERFLKQKAKIEWLEVGDSNSAYFHKTIKSQYQKCRIDVIINENNVEFTSADVLNVFVTHYEMFLGTGMDCDDINVEGLFQKKVSDASFIDMVRPVFEVEIKGVMFDISDDRAPGPDGYTSAFFNKS